jgi:hypothetical protein
MNKNRYFFFACAMVFLLLPDVPACRHANNLFGMGEQAFDLDQEAAGVGVGWYIRRTEFRHVAASARYRVSVHSKPRLD